VIYIKLLHLVTLVIILSCRILVTLDGCHHLDGLEVERDHLVDMVIVARSDHQL
jgi:cobalamin synthase